MDKRMIENNGQSEVSVTSVRKPSQLRGLVIFLVISIGIIVGIYFLSPMIPSISRAPSGEIYMTLLSNDRSHSGVFVYDFEDNNLTPYLFDEDDRTAYVASSLSPDGGRVAYSRPIRGGSQMVVKDIASGRELVIQGTPEIFSRRNPTWSPDGNLLVYQTRKDAAGGVVNPDGWYIYAYNLLAQQERYVVDGFGPTFAPTGELFFLRRDGLYKYSFGDLENGQKIWSMENGVAQANMMIDVSPNGKKIAWSLPDDGKLMVINILSMNPLNLEVDNQLDARGFWPIFSPDSSFLGFQEVDWNSGIPTNPRLIYFNLRNYRKTLVLDLKDYVQTSMFVTDWR